MIYDFYGEKRDKTPNKDIVSSMFNRIKHEESVEGYEGKTKEDRYRSLWEIYYYLSYGHYTRAWKKINGLSDEIRWKIPGDVYHFLEKLHDKNYAR